MTKKQTLQKELERWAHLTRRLETESATMSKTTRRHLRRALERCERKIKELQSDERLG